MNVEAITHKDVRGKDIYYVSISNGVDKIFINVNKVKFDEVNDFLSPKKNDNESKRNSGRKP